MTVSLVTEDDKILASGEIGRALPSKPSAVARTK
jgi:hypothetical protein